MATTSCRPGSAKTVQERAEAYFIGKDPFDIETAQRAVFPETEGSRAAVLLEIGLWDLMGKACGQPLYKLWGARSAKVQPYAATVHFDRTPAQRADDALRFYEMGFRAIKFRIHHDCPADDLGVGGDGDEGGRRQDGYHGRCEPGGQDKPHPPPVWDYDRALTMAKELDPWPCTGWKSR